MDPSFKNISFYICILKNMYISQDLWRQKLKWPKSLVSFVENFMPIPNICSYMRPSFLFEKSVAFFVLKFHISWKFVVHLVVLCRVSKQSTLGKKIVFLLRMGTTSKISKTRLNLHKILVLRGYKVEKYIFFLHFCIKRISSYMTSWSKMASTFSFLW